MQIYLTDNHRNQVLAHWLEENTASVINYYENIWDSNDCLYIVTVRVKLSDIIKYLSKERYYAEFLDNDGNIPF